MGYVEKIMGDSEKMLYRTHQHPIVLVQRVAGWLFAFLVFVAVAVMLLVAKNDDIRFAAGVVALCSLILPIYAFIRGWKRGKEDGKLLKQIWWPLLACIFILAVALILMFKPSLKEMWIVAAVVAIIPLIELILAFMNWLNERYIITNRRVMVTKGILNKNVSDSALEKVNDVELRQSVAGRILGWGTVEIITGSDIGMNIFHRISNPVRFKRAMLNAKEQVQVMAVEAVLGPALPAQQAATPASGAPVSAGNIGDRLIELTELRQKNVISEAEFQAKRKELLDQL